MQSEPLKPCSVIFVVLNNYQMKRTYCRLSSELLWLDTEAGFMACSVRVDADFTVEEYQEYTFDGGSTTHEITFDE